MNVFDSNMKYVMMNTIRKLNIYPLGAYYRLRSNENLRLLVPDLVNTSVGKWEDITIL